MMKPKAILLVACSICAVLSAGMPARAALVALSDILPGTETVTLVPNGDFESPGGATAFPTGWSRFGDMFAEGAVGGIVPASTGLLVAGGHVDGGGAVGVYAQGITLAPNTEYVLSAYMWNFGGPGNSVNANVDLSDAAGEAQLTLTLASPNAADGFFASGTFNTAITGTNLTVRVFYDGKVGFGSAHPFIGSQWDNVAITPSAIFQPPIAVPEPASITLLITGILGLGLFLRRRRSGE